jgi:hypothetical protein
MYLIAAVLACLSEQPTICDVYALPTLRDDGYEMTWGDCLGVGGQVSLMKWLKDNPGMIVKRGPICDYGNDPHRGERLFKGQGTPI